MNGQWAAIIGVAALVGVALLAQPAGAAAPDCAGLAQADFSRIPDAPTQVTVTEVVEAPADGLPAYCRVQGYINPNVGIELRLPMQRWNGKYFQVGCGGWCGFLFDGPFLRERCDAPLRKGYACVATDSGHKGVDLKWAYNNTQAEIDYAYRSTHVTAIAGKVIAERFYGKAASRSYFMGCSGGGREGLLEAQRFPQDFDGIIAGAPAISVTGGVMRLLWAAGQGFDKNGKVLLTPEDAKQVHRAAVESCDRDDGVQDGIIGNPLACRFDPAVLQCNSGQRGGCLSAPQVDAVKRIYGGPKRSDGTALYTGGDVPGAELEWTFMVDAWADLFRYGAFVPDPGPGWKWSDFDFDQDPQRLGQMESLYSATNPDLRRFKARGGKIILYHGWADHLQSGLNSIDYYETARNTMGGRAATEEFFRLFLMPGVAHCMGGTGADTVDHISYLEAWVERGEPPDLILGVKLKPGTDPAVLPAEQSSILFTRPYYPYPRRATYSGRGATADAGNWKPVE